MMVIMMTTVSIIIIIMKTHDSKFCPAEEYLMLGHSCQLSRIKKHIPTTAGCLHCSKHYHYLTAPNYNSNSPAPSHVTNK